MNTETTGRLRLFFGLGLDPKTREYVKEVTKELSLRIEGVRWIPGENLHVTLKFLGSCEAEKVPGLRELMEEAAVDLPLELEVGGVGGFPSQSSARVVWVGAEDVTGGIQRVYKSLDRGAQKIGVKREKRPYKPHITIGRARKKPVNIAEKVLKYEGTRLTLNVEEIILFHSELTSKGARYSVVHGSGTGR